MESRFYVYKFKIFLIHIIAHRKKDPGKDGFLMLAATFDTMVLANESGEHIFHLANKSGEP